jgi:hypothetical protein
LRTTVVTTAVAALFFWTAGCAQPKVDLENADTRQMLALLMPQRVEIVEAFTAFRSLDQGTSLNGIELMLQPVDSFGDPVRIAGLVRAELDAFRRASGEPVGQRLCEPWEIPLTSEPDQRRYWNKVTGMYEIPLKLPADVRLSAEKYVLQVTYNSPLGEHLTDECILALPSGARPAEAPATRPASASPTGGAKKSSKARN